MKAMLWLFNKKGIRDDDEVGTGTLQETCLGDFKEIGALDLRSSTEELYFMEQGVNNNKMDNSDLSSSLNQTQSSRRSPVSFKLEEHQSSMYIHYHRKDSANSEVAALLSISGRTSRISSVGSQGSAVSRLSAISGASRSPSPHRMLLETSFCGPKPVVDSICESTIITCEDSSAEILEQVLLSRKHDPTKAVLAEGIQIDCNESPKKYTLSPNKSETDVENQTINIAKQEPKTIKPLVRVQIGFDKTSSETCSQPKSIIGVTASGTEYVRIKLKPDHLYNDKGLGQNERVVDELLEDIVKKPASLNLNTNNSIQMLRSLPGENVPTATSTLGKSIVSPKLTRHIAITRDQGSRSPSPATISRKSSFCSLFKTKDLAISPDSPRDLSRSKSQDRAGSSSGFESTPNKQKSVLAIFKPGSRKFCESKSKTTSPVDAVDYTIKEQQIQIPNNLTQVDFRFKPSQSCAFPTNSKTTEYSSRSRLRYYDVPADGAIHIPLHTPPEEKEIAISNLGSQHNTDINNPPETSKINNLPLTSSNSTLTLKTTQLKKNDEINEHLSLCDLKYVKSTIKSSSQEILMETATKINKASNCNNNYNNKKSVNNETSDLQTESQNLKSDVNLTENHLISYISTPSQATTSAIITREKKHILFSTKIGSGSEEQIFSTQFSLSKTESLSSQISECATICDVQTPNFLENVTTVSSKSQILVNDDSATMHNRKQIMNSNGDKVILRSKKQTLQEELSSVVEIFQEKITSNGKTKSFIRDSKYIENVDEIMEAQKKLTESLSKNKRDNYSEEGSPVMHPSQHSRNNPVNDEIDARSSIEKSSTNTITAQSIATKESNFESIDTKQSFIMTPATSSDYHGSSESEKESENGSFISSRQTKSRSIHHHHHHHHHARNSGSSIDDHESAGLVSQQSFDEDLPYIPTTLPEERARGVSLIPVKERINMEIKMCPVERPRSTTPINPASLEEYCGVIMTTSDDGENLTPRAEKLRISLPRRNSKENDAKSNLLATETKSPRRLSTTTLHKNWFDFPSKQNNVIETTDKDWENQPPPPLPPRRIVLSLTSTLSNSNIPPKNNTQQWINFEEIPEKKKIPKKITTLPAKEQQRHYQQHTVQYSFVNPEDCQCECHENEKTLSPTLTQDNVNLEAKSQHRPLNNFQIPPEEVEPLLQPDHSDCIDRTR